MYRYKLLKDYNSPRHNIDKGVIKTDNEWTDIFDITITDLDVKDDWFEKVNIVDINKHVNKTLPHMTHQDKDAIESCILSVLEEIIDSIENDHEFDSNEYVKERYFEYYKSDEIHDAYDGCKRKIIEMIREAIKDTIKEK